MEFNEIITYPTESDDWIRTVLIGGILVFFGFLLVPLFFVYGYLVRTINRSLAGERAPPIFDDWKTLLVDGVQAWVISIVYLLVPLIVAGVTIGGAMTAIAAGGEGAAAIGAGSLFFGLALSSILFLVFGYLGVIGIVSFAREGQFGAAFDVETIKTVAANREYAIAWLVSVVILFIVSLVGAIPLVGWILAPFAGFYGAVIAANLWAGGFNEAIEMTPEITRPSDEESTV